MQTAVSSSPSSLERPQCGEGVDVGAVVAAVEGVID